MLGIICFHLADPSAERCEKQAGEFSVMGVEWGAEEGTVYLQDSQIGVLLACY